MNIPAIAIPKKLDSPPSLVECKNDLYEYPHEWPDFVFYGPEGCFEAEISPVGKAPGILARLFGGLRQRYMLRFSPPSPFEIAELRAKLETLIDEDDDCMTQYHEPEVLKYLLNQCENFAEVLAWGCLTGALYGNGVNPTLPELCEEASEGVDPDADELPIISATGYSGPLSIEHIRECARGITSESLPDTLEC